MVRAPERYIRRPWVSSTSVPIHFFFLAWFDSLCHSGRLWFYLILTLPRFISFQSKLMWSYFEPQLSVKMNAPVVMFGCTCTYSAVYSYYVHLFFWILANDETIWGTGSKWMTFISQTPSNWKFLDSFRLCAARRVWIQTSGHFEDYVECRSAIAAVFKLETCSLPIQGSIVERFVTNDRERETFCKNECISVRNVARATLNS